MIPNRATHHSSFDCQIHHFCSLSEAMKTRLILSIKDLFLIQFSFVAVSLSEKSSAK